MPGIVRVQCHGREVIVDAVAKYAECILGDRAITTVKVLDGVLSGSAQVAWADGSVLAFAFADMASAPARVDCVKVHKQLVIPRRARETLGKAAEVRIEPLDICSCVR
jgi:prepilin-type processing-associated H-X9-DG protein